MKAGKEELHTSLRTQLLFGYKALHEFRAFLAVDLDALGKKKFANLRDTSSLLVSH